MDFDSLRPVLSGIVGGSIAIWIGARWQRRQSSADRRSSQLLARSHKLASILASALFFSGLIAAIALYKIAGFENTDWVPFALGAGGGCFAAMLVLALVPFVRGQSIKESYLAFANSQQSSPLVVYAILGFGSVGCFFALAKLLA